MSLSRQRRPLGRFVELRPTASLAASRRAAPLRPGQRKRRARVPAKMRARVYQRSGGVCVACAALRGLEASALPSARARRLLRQGLARACAHIHHVLPVQTWPDLELVEDNMVGVCVECHDEHERAHRRIPRGALPRRAVMLAAAVGPAAADYVERTYAREGPTADGIGPQ